MGSMVAVCCRFKDLNEKFLRTSFRSDNNAGSGHDGAKIIRSPRVDSSPRPSGCRPSGDRPGSGDVIDHYQYLVLMGACLLITLPLELLVGARVYRRPAALVRALLPVVVVFTVWDIAGIVAGHWSYNAAFVSGVRLMLGMPLEELVFFVVVPICGLLTYEAVGIILRRLRPSAGPPSASGAGPDAVSGAGSGGVGDA